MYPLARKKDLYVEQLPDEAVVYDKLNHQAHCLNSTVFTVWENADGTRTVGELAQLLHDKLGMPLSRDVVLLALEDLNQSNLLEKQAALGTSEPLPSRREIGRKLALAGVSASLLPFVASIVAPTPAMARSYTSANYGKELAAVTSEIKGDLTELKANKNGSLTDYNAAMADGAAGVEATITGNKSAAATDFQNAETQFNDMLNALGLPPL